MGGNLVTIDIADENSLLRACDILHDARFDLSTARFDELAGRWQAMFVREFFEDLSLLRRRRFLFLSWYTFPMAETTLQLSEITSYHINDRSQIGTYSFNECRPQRGSYRLAFCEDMEISMTFRDKPEGKLQDIKLLDERGSYWAIGDPLRTGQTALFH